MPTVASKFLDKAEEFGVGRDVIAKGALSAVVAFSVVRFAYPIVKRKLAETERSANGNNNNSKSIVNKNRVKPNGGHSVSSMEDSSGEEEYTAEEERRMIEAEKLLAQQALLKKVKPPGINKEFFQQLQTLIKIMIPRPFCNETGLLAVHTLCLVSRTFLSLIVASMEGRMNKFIVRKDAKNFAWMLIQWFGIAIPATFINSMIRYLENKLALAFRTRLVRHAYKMYFNDQVYYKVSNLDGRIENADHRLTDDISTFASSIAHLYSSLTKPCFDLLLIGFTLARSSQRMNASIVKGPLLGFLVIATTGHILRRVAPKFGQLVSEEANRYGYLRHIHSRIITNAEEIAFYGGHKVELQQLREAYDRLTRQMNNIYSQKLWFIMLEQFFMKYVWSGTGMVMVSLPILTTTAADNETKELQVSNRTEWLTTARNLLSAQADAIERLMSSYKEIVALAGYTDRVAGMFTVFRETSKGIYSRNVVMDAKNSAVILECDDNGKPIAKGKIIHTDDPSNMEISLVNVPVVTPNCDIVVPNLTLQLHPGMHLLITGPNGCGKSSLFRILSGLWPIYAGELTLPRPVEGKHMMFYIPQRPYLSIGSLRDQIIYPDTRQDMINKNVSEETLTKILQMVSLDNIAKRDNFDEVRDWKDILSGGEKQRMAIARLFYHRPQYALLDECTSAVSIDVESSIYETAKSMGITLLTITHRPTLWKFHTHILEFDGQGGWTFNQLDGNAQQRSPAKH